MSHIYLEKFDLLDVILARRGFKLFNVIWMPHIYFEKFDSLDVILGATGFKSREVEINQCNTRP